MPTPRRWLRHLTPSLFISLLALVIATSTGAYAVANLEPGEVRTRHIATQAVTTPKLDKGAVNSSRVKNFSLRLVDLGGKDHRQAAVTSQVVDVPAGGCVRSSLRLYNPAPDGVIGSLVVGHLTSSTGGAVLSNAGVVVPTVVSETSQGGAIANLMICASSPQTVPVGSIFHFQLIGPGE